MGFQLSRRLGLSWVSILLTASAALSCGPTVDDPRDPDFNGDPSYGARENVGDSAHDLLSDARFKSLKVEIQNVRG
jgi:hypothetical protein